MKSHSSSAFRLLIEETDRFRCSGCGNCCRAGWSIPVEPELRERLASDPTHKGLVEPGQNPVSLSASGRCEVGRRPGGACVFLDSGSLCRLHAEFGEKQKPLACQVFPYILVPTPAGTVVALSHFCPAVRQANGPPLTRQAAAIEDLVEVARLPMTLSGPFRVAGDVTTGWTGYAMYEAALLDRLESAPEPQTELDTALASLTCRYPMWGRAELPELLTGCSLLEVELAERLAYELLTKAGGQPGVGQTSTPVFLRPFLRSLVRRKLLLRYPTILEGLALLSLIPRAVMAHQGGAEQAVELLELLVGHGPGAFGLALPLTKSARQVSSGSPAPD